MTKQSNDREMRVYSEAVSSGRYAKTSGLSGKYDNVRRYWEDEITRRFLRPYLHDLVERCRSKMQRLRIMDLGCGSADGYELLCGVRHQDASLQSVEVDLLTPDVLGFYKGIDLNVDLLKQAADLYGNDPKMVFEQGDFTKALPLKDGEKPYDLYFTSYGTCSHHNDDETLIALLAEIAERTQDYCIIVCDWLGRYSYEWQNLWTNDLSENRNMDYVVSYIYGEEEREQKRDELEHLSLRLMTREEANQIIRTASDRAGVPITPMEFFDRSVFTGRHMDTGDYNPHTQPIRQIINSLHETNERTDLKQVMINYVPKPGFDVLNDYFDHLQMCWNTLVQYASDLMEQYDEKEQSFAVEPAHIPGYYPEVLRQMCERMKRVVQGVGWLGIGLPRENIIEPQLGYALQRIVTDTQKGQGCAHGLVGILEINKE